jgi:hypothetical protein
MSNRLYLVVSATIFTLVAIAHLLRVILGIPVQIADEMVPMSVSVLGVLVPAFLAATAVRLLRARQAG